MLDTTQNFIIVILTVAGSLLFMRMLNWLWPAVKRRQHNDLIGWQLSILGTTYAVMMGFMLYTVWTNFGLADLNADAEANALVNLYRLAEGLPVEQRAKLEQTTRAYADVVVEKDWPAMVDGNVSAEGHQYTREMWQTLMSVKAASPTEITAEDHALYELSAMGEHRRIRVLQCTARLPGVLWCVLLIGGAVTIFSSCMFGAGNSLLHALQVSALSLLIALVLVAIADIDRPFQGSVHVHDTAFRRAQQSMKE